MVLALATGLHRQSAARVLCTSPSFVIQLAAMERRVQDEQIGAIVLAAGSAQRMGRLKQLLPIGDSTMVHHVTSAVVALRLAQVIVVTGAKAGAVGKALADLPVDIVVNESWAKGMSSSMHVGLRALRPDQPVGQAVPLQLSVILAVKQLLKIAHQ